MPQLSRIHFASIGHADARLAPLHLDLRGDDGPVDSLLWLRNGGGKSSILNLFYSLFRPGRLEFLGGKAEAKTRHLEEYVQGSDLAAVVTEWQISAQTGLFQELDSGTRLVIGQALAWKGGRVSRDHEQLKKVFFSFRAGFGLELEALPFQGLTGGVGSLEAVKEWFAEAARAYPRAEIVTEGQYKRWGEHLDRLGLDPELFRYQVDMNQREGAADEQFRFATPEAFVRFFLKLTSETHRANELKGQLEILRERLELKPARELEKQFLGGATGALSKLSHAVTEWSGTRETEAAAMKSVAALASGLGAERAQLERKRSDLKIQSDQAEHTRLAAYNEAANRSRWARGLRRKAALVQVEELKEEKRGTEQARQAVKARQHVLKAAQALHDIRPRRARQEELLRALHAEEKSRAPLIAAVEEAGGWLAALLDRAIADSESRRDTYTKLRHAALEEAQALNAEIQERAREEGRRGQEIESFEEKISHRDRERQRLLSEGILQRRESVSGALERHETAMKDIGIRLEARYEERSRATALISRAQESERRLQDALRKHAAKLAAEEALLKQGLSTRDRLQASRWIQSIEETSEPNVMNPGLVTRLLSTISSKQRKLLGLGVDGAEDVRALRSIKAGGLLPPTRDGERLVGVLDELGVTAYTAFEWLAKNIPREQRKRIILHDPARYTGVIVQRAADLEAIDGLGEELALQVDLDSPVQVSLAASALEGATEGDSSRRVIPPATDGAWDVDAASARQSAIEARQIRRDRESRVIQSEIDELQALARDLRHFQKRYGDGRLDELEASVGALERLIQETEQGIVEAQHEQERQRGQLAVIEDQIAAESSDRERYARATQTLRDYERNHESLLPQWREGLERARQALSQLRQARGNLDRQIAAAQENAHLAQREALSAERDLKELRRERATVRQAPLLEHTSDLQLPAARERYQLRQKSLDRELSQSNLAGQLETLNQDVDAREQSLARLSAGLDAAAIRELADQGDIGLEAEQRAADQAYESLTQALGRLAADLAQAEAEVREHSKLRRDAGDLPPLDAFPKTATELRALADSYEKESNQCSAEETAAAERLQALRSQITGLGQRIQLIEGQEERLLDAAGQAGEAPAAAIPHDDAALKAEVSARLTTLKQAAAQSQSAQERARNQAEAVRTYATEARFATHKSQVKERLQDTPEMLIEHAAVLLQGIEGRRTVVEEELASITRDQENLVASLDTLGSDALRLLRRAERVSILPEGLGEWSGRPYLKIQANVPKATAERQALLTHMVSELVRKGTIPSGVALLQSVAESLAGHQGFKVTILKPDAALRPKRLPITDMTAFSRGQQLTAAILLYCTLVRLRARTRGKTPGSDAGALILDNPIGTCSSVPLLELQRDFARKMGVQLVYTTGVRDLDALATLPNVVRLRNTHQDRNTGHQHVTVEGGEGVEAVRVVHREGA